VRAINQLVELQQRLIVNNPETSYILSHLNITQSSSQNENGNGLKRKRTSSSNDKDDDESNQEEEDADDDDDQDDDDEEIFSDTDEEMKATEAKKLKKQKIQSNFKFTPLKENDFEEYLSKFNKEYQKYR
jgi:hypothetical protein